MASDGNNAGGNNSSSLLREEVYEKLKDDIRHGKLLPGEPISGNQLSEELGVSRTPVREALQRLNQEGLVRTVPGQGVTVAAPSIEEVLNTIHVRLILEPELARLVSRGISDEDADRLQAAVDDMDEAVEEGEPERWLEADTRFHEILSESCPNDLLGQLALQMRNRINNMTADIQSSSDRVGECTHEHRRVVEAILDGRGDDAAEVARAHLENLRESLFRKLMHR